MTRQGTYLLIAAALSVSVFAQDTTTEPPETTTDPVYAEGCRACREYRCPNDPEDCLLGTVPDTCGCCGTRGVCARLDGEPCWNSSIPELPLERRNEGLCARNYVCRLRTDLDREDTPEATCVCMEQSLACGSDNRTYDTPCTLHEKATSQRSSTLKLVHLGPCPSRPKIYTAPEETKVREGHFIALNCEAKGFPLPDVFWEFRSADGTRVLRYPNDEVDDAEVNSSQADPMMRVSWLQLARIKPRHAGIYNCIANNTVGEASASAVVTVY